MYFSTLGHFPLQKGYTSINEMAKFSNNYNMIFKVKLLFLIGGVDILFRLKLNFRYFKLFLLILFHLGQSD